MVDFIYSRPTCIIDNLLCILDFIYLYENRGVFVFKYLRVLSVSLVYTQHTSTGCRKKYNFISFIVFFKNCF